MVELAVTMFLHKFIWEIAQIIFISTLVAPTNYRLSRLGFIRHKPRPQIYLHFDSYHRTSICPLLILHVSINYLRFLNDNSQYWSFLHIKFLENKQKSKMTGNISNQFHAGHIQHKFQIVITAFYSFSPSICHIFPKTHWSTVLVKREEPSTASATLHEPLHNHSHQI